MTIKFDNLVSDIGRNGGVCYFVGGYVRDSLLSPKIKSKDKDIEVHNIEPNKLKKILCQHGEVMTVGESYKIFKVDLKDGEDIYDFSLPREDSSTGPGHKDFDCTSNPFLGTEKASKRRNFTVNSAMINCHNGDFVDHHGAYKDIKHLVLRPVSKDTYADDPLRNLIGLQQCARFGFMPKLSDLELYRKCNQEYSSLPPSRIWGEWEKSFEKGVHWQMFMKKMSVLDLDRIYPELLALSVTEQDEEWHPEGNADIHSELAAEWVADYCEVHGIKGEDRVVLVCAALIHDIAKPICTTHDDDGHIRSKGHDKLSIELEDGSEGPAVSFLKRIHMPKKLVERVLPLVKEHMVHVGRTLKKSAVRRLADRIFPATLKELDIIIQADHAARPPMPSGHPCPELMQMAEELDVASARPKPMIKGRDLISRGIKPGPEMGKLIKEAFQLQLDGKFNTVEEGLDLILK